jgi:predicted GNAT family acetyltransferase
VAAEIRHDEARHAFLLTEDGAQAFLTYQPLDARTVDFATTFVPVTLRGRGLGSRLVITALEWARDRGYRVVPSCWFVGTVVAEHPEYRPLLAT